MSQTPEEEAQDFMSRAGIRAIHNNLLLTTLTNLISQRNEYRDDYLRMASTATNRELYSNKLKDQITASALSAISDKGGVMLISDVIKKLQGIKAGHGDLEVDLEVHYHEGAFKGHARSIRGAVYSFLIREKAVIIIGEEKGKP